MNERERFRKAFEEELTDRPGKAPGPASIARKMGLRNTRNLNGRLTSLRTVMLEARGFKKNSETNRWYLP